MQISRLYVPPCFVPRSLDTHRFLKHSQTSSMLLCRNSSRIDNLQIIDADSFQSVPQVQLYSVSLIEEHPQTVLPACCSHVAYEVHAASRQPTTEMNPRRDVLGCYSRKLLLEKSRMPALERPRTLNSFCYRFFDFSRLVQGFPRRIRKYGRRKQRAFLSRLRNLNKGET